MTNTYKDDVPYEVKVLEEIRCIRCVNERILRAMEEAQFPGYQMEKFSGSAESRNLCADLLVEFSNIRKESEILLNKLNTNLYVDYLMEKAQSQSRNTTNDDENVDYRGYV